MPGHSLELASWRGEWSRCGHANPRLAKCSDLGGRRQAFPVSHAAEICEALSNS